MNNKWFTFFPQLINGLALLDIGIFYSLSSDYLSYILSIYVLQVNQAVSDFSNERDKVVGQLREAEVPSIYYQ